MLARLLFLPYLRHLPSSSKMYKTTVFKYWFARRCELLAKRVVAMPAIKYFYR